MKEPFEFLEHMADIKFKAYGGDLNEVFQNCVLALANYLVSEQKIKNKKGKVIQVKGEDKESLLYNFMDEILYVLDTEHFITSHAVVSILGNNLKAELYGDDAKNYDIQQVKAATYAEMKVQKKDLGWEATVVLDV